ncbi:MAG: sucrase ferredoxin [Tildeniella torsiva UHER 1998/13D]|jgi:hypothetical protein|nr:sucrase ferredoxin [Tildeniella torsiva UHER 1998/13D]
MLAKSSFCADVSAQMGEDLIGYAINTPLYILTECPPPWTANALDSPRLPAELKTCLQQCQQTQGVRPLLIYNPQIQQTGQTRVMIFRQPTGLATGYHVQEFQVASLEAVVPLLTTQLIHPQGGERPAEIRDILICTHGSHDRCCARYGKPFFYRAAKTVEALEQPQVRVWQVSHIGCHRFAPTLIDLPSGRYYGRLTPDSFAALLTRTGPIQVMAEIYRGWGMLPYEAQPLERELMLRHGWDWLDYPVSCRLIEAHPTKPIYRFELRFKPGAGAIKGYSGEVIEDGDRTIQLKVSCNSEKPSELAPAIVKNIEAIEVEPCI